MTQTQKGNYTIARQLWRPLLLLFLFALVIRLIYLFIALDCHGIDGFWAITPDTHVYWSVASEILGGDIDGQYSLFRVGPGYGFILAVIRLVFGDNPIYAILFSVLMGALAPVAVYLFSFSLFRSKKLALAAGIISALSVTSISLSSHILTDQTYFTMQCLALFVFVEGIRKNHLGWFIGSGLLIGAGALVRPSGQIWPILLLIIPLLIAVPRTFKSRLHLARRTAVTGLIALAIMLAWMGRNYAVNGIFTFGSNGMLTVRNCMVTMIEANGDRGKAGRIREEYVKQDGDFGPDYANAYNLAKARIEKTVDEHLGKMIQYYFQIVWENVHEPNYYPTLDLPIVRQSFAPVLTVFDRVNRVLALITVGAIILLAARKNRSAFVMLGVTYWAFTVLLGFSYWQGSRLHYAAEMAWAVMLPYMMIWLWSCFARLMKKLTNREYWSAAGDRARLLLSEADSNKL